MFQRLEHLSCIRADFTALPTILQVMGPFTRRGSGLTPHLSAAFRFDDPHTPGLEFDPVLRQCRPDHLRVFPIMPAPPINQSSGPDFATISRWPCGSRFSSRDAPPLPAAPTEPARCTRQNQLAAPTEPAPFAARPPAPDLHILDPALSV